MNVNKVSYGGRTLIDLTSDTVTPQTLVKGATAHNAAGEQIVGTNPGASGDMKKSDYDPDSNISNVGGIKAYTAAQLQPVQTSLSNLLYPNAGAHNAVYRGKFLGNTVTAAQYAAIKAGTFDDLYIGDYWNIGGVTYRIAAFDYYLRTGDTSCDTHHVTLVPDAPMYNHVMNDTATTAGSYYGSKMKTSGLANALATIKADFGADHVLTHRVLLPNAVSNNASSGWVWSDSQIDLMTERMVYGSHALGGDSENGYDVGIDKSQLALFQERPDLITNRENWWLRDVDTWNRFCTVSKQGYAAAWPSSDSLGVRPYFCIY